MPFFPSESSSDVVRDLLEDFDYVVARQYAALIQRGEATTAFGENVRAAVSASALRLRSLDYARSRYVDGAPHAGRVERHVPYIEAYKAAKGHVLRTMKKLRTEGRPEPALGVFGASVVLERLPSSFFSAHLLYRLGHKYEGHAVSRLILEQIAWAYAACKSDDMAFIEAISPTRSVGLLKRFLPSVGRLYGFLSLKTHIDYSSHQEFLGVANESNYVRHARPDFKEYASTVLTLADAHAVIWEYSQADYIDEFESVERGPDAALVPAAARPFLSSASDLLERIPESESQ